MGGSGAVTFVSKHLSLQLLPVLLNSRAAVGFKSFDKSFNPLLHARAGHICLCCPRK